MNKVVVRLTGGLGNQLHQYAFGLILAKRNNAELLVDINFLTKYSLKKNVTIRNFELDKFNLNTKFYNSILSRQWILVIINRFTIIEKILNLLDINVVIKYKSIKECLSRGCRLTYLNGIIGNWTDYQEDVDFLRGSMQISRDLRTLALKVDNTLASYDNLVSIHVRRSDYLYIDSIHEVLSLSYYEAAIAYCEKHIPCPTFVIFSDDVEFIRRHFSEHKFIRLKYTDSNSDFFDFLAMKKCKHHIIANSTFSWWAAFLGEDTDSISIAPKLFLKKETVNTQDLYPENWLIL
jgi:hypothetical protein